MAEDSAVLEVSTNCRHQIGDVEQMWEVRFEIIRNSMAESSPTDIFLKIATRSWTAVEERHSNKFDSRGN
jgi:hypothetical protein